MDQMIQQMIQFLSYSRGTYYLGVEWYQATQMRALLCTFYSSSYSSLINQYHNFIKYILFQKFFRSDQRSSGERNIFVFHAVLSLPVYRVLVNKGFTKKCMNIQSSLSIVDLKGLALKIHNREKSIIKRL